MTDRDRDSLDLKDDDRLPWLEPAEDEHEEHVHVGRVVAVVLGGLLFLAAVIGGIYWWQNREVALDGEGELIAAPEGDYKVKPDDPGGMEIEGEGDTSFATSEGAEPGATIDAGAVPEAPVERRPIERTERTLPPPAKSATTVVPESGGALVAKTPEAAPARPAGAAGRGTVIQLGAFDSEAVANKAWERASGRFAFLSPLSKTVVRATVGGRTYFRLRADTGSSGAAKDFCGRLKVAGENCLVVAQ